MTEVEVTRLLGELVGIGKTLNQESDSINGLIERFEAKLCELNLGLEVWSDDPVRSEILPGGSLDTQLGFGKNGQQWHLQLRTVQWKEDRADGWKVVSINSGIKLLTASRDDRIAALSKFPTLLRTLKGKAESAVRAIQDAKAFVK